MATEAVAHTLVEAQGIKTALAPRPVAGLHSRTRAAITSLVALRQARIARTGTSSLGKPH